jgi:hypothetical protein
VITGTGYEFNLDKIAFINGALAKGIRRHELGPKLSAHFESSIRDLYFIGPIAAESFGPLVRFVAGAPFAVSRVARHIDRTSRPRRGPRSSKRSGSKDVSAPYAAR